MAALTGRREIARAASTITATKTVGKAAVRVGATSQRLSWAAAAIFGTNQGIQRTGPSGRSFIGYQQFQQVDSRGGVVYRAIAAESDAITEAYAVDLERLLSAAFPD
jgi:hypothetical protein